MHERSSGLVVFPGTEQKQRKILFGRKFHHSVPRNIPPQMATQSEITRYMWKPFPLSREAAKTYKDMRLIRVRLKTGMLTMFKEIKAKFKVFIR